MAPPPAWAGAKESRVARAASKSQEVRSKLGHPVVDADGHLQEFVPVLKDYVLDRLREIGGPSMVEQFERVGLTYRTSVADRWMDMTWEERRRTWTSVPALVGPAEQEHPRPRRRILPRPPRRAHGRARHRLRRHVPQPRQQPP